MSGTAEILARIKLAVGVIEVYVRCIYVVMIFIQSEIVSYEIDAAVVKMVLEEWMNPTIQIVQYIPCVGFKRRMIDR